MYRALRRLTKQFAEIFQGGWVAEKWDQSLTTGAIQRMGTCIIIRG